ncbi:hypothetical protein [Alcanivorax sp.]|uniref:hypothetical protein n=1 Tax=Alcanivorax sp. TaxID=1872427 RepID=UPI003BAD9EB4
MTEKPSAPSMGLLLGESRAMLAYGRYLLRGLGHRQLPAGNGQPVLVLPGFGASDASTRPLRRALTRLGYSVYGWAQGNQPGHEQQAQGHAGEPAAGHPDSPWPARGADWLEPGRGVCPGTGAGPTRTGSARCSPWAAPHQRRPGSQQCDHPVQPL